MKPAIAVLFDLDGTLTDSSLGIFRCFRHAFVRYAETGGPTVDLPDDSELRWIVGPPLRESFAKLAGEAAKERLMGFYLERYSPIGAFENRVYDGVVDALQRCATAGARLFVATSKNERDARAILEHFGLANRFESINGARLDGSRAAKRELIGDAVAAHGLKLGEDRIAMIGDREFDMRGAREVGVAAIGALWGYGTRAELVVAGAEALATTPLEAAEIALTR
jgi:phosphoglycolate phosphatase